MAVLMKALAVLLVLCARRCFADKRSFKVGVSESVDPGHVITSVRTLYLQWWKGDGQFRITSGNKDDRFTIGNETGDVIVKRYLNYDIEPHYELRVTNDKAERKREIKIRISVEDELDYPPTFNPNCYIPPRVRDTTEIWPLMGTLHSFLGYQNLFSNRKNGSKSVMVLDNDRCDAKVFSICKSDFWDDTIPEGTTPFFNFECTNDQEPRRSLPTITPYWNASYERPDDSTISPQWFVDKPKKKFLRHILLEINVENFITESPSLYKCTMEFKAPNFGFKASMGFGIEALGCPAGFFGGNCSEICVCQNGGSCHPFNGACKCPDGWKGRACDIKDPKVAMSPTYQNVTSGQTARLSCVALNVHSSSTFAWALNGKQLSVEGNNMVTLQGFNTQFNRTFVNVTITVVITNLDMSGEYACAYKATDGRVYRQFAKVALEGNFSPQCGSCLPLKSVSGESVALYVVSGLAVLFLLVLITQSYLKHKLVEKEKAITMVTKNDPDVKKPIAEFPDMVRRATVENEYTV
ncbi:PREDICTED: uncharacterized protein LOC109467180 [Branchiostoma belcheri]|uniref:Uncharacterized protein LOC109467180 n=1 Tax=Branchiostoma belcheri TaxID=7741 RepID=A0A6P4YPU7_BRABE|nr:PREDICTED: uncharacterized protein LOC109467180 [Branchiostoma belcheri]